MKKINVVFCGTPDFAVPALDMLLNHPHVKIKFVISMPDRPAGRGQQLKSPEVIDFAKNNKIKYFQTVNINKEIEFLENLESDKIDCFIVLAFAQFLGKRVLELPKLGCFNIHTSLLPKYRGAAPIQYALLNGDKKTGVSIQKMVKKMDAGDIVADKEVTINETETGGQLYTRLKYQAAITLNDFIYNIVEDQITSYTQNEDDISLAPTLNKEDGHLNFVEESFTTINNKVRALKPWPGTFCLFNGKRMKVLEIEKYPSLNLDPGVVKVHDKKLLIGCKDSTVRLCYIQQAGKKACSDAQLSNGLHNSTEPIVIG